MGIVDDHLIVWKNTRPYINGDYAGSYYGLPIIDERGIPSGYPNLDSPYSLAHINEWKTTYPYVYRRSFNQIVYAMLARRGGILHNCRFTFDDVFPPEGCKEASGIYGATVMSDPNLFASIPIGGLVRFVNAYTSDYHQRLWKKGNDGVWVMSPFLNAISDWSNYPCITSPAELAVADIDVWYPLHRLFGGLPSQTDLLKWMYWKKTGSNSWKPYAGKAPYVLTVDRLNRIFNEQEYMFGDGVTPRVLTWPLSSGTKWHTPQGLVNDLAILTDLRAFARVANGYHLSASVYPWYSFRWASVYSYSAGHSYPNVYSHALSYGKADVAGLRLHWQVNTAYTINHSRSGVSPVSGSAPIPTTNYIDAGLYSPVMTTYFDNIGAVTGHEEWRSGQFIEWPCYSRFRLEDTTQSGSVSDWFYVRNTIGKKNELEPTSFYTWPY